ncbi:MAG: efflux RND transporter permease subunit [Lentisphaeria bacterium]|nr:efflux RND transporter permease subunit [Lentisphaeria bacterium]MBQ9087160.1 efflux RND transporter permease subunit [Lentisphaeria bacterium]
MTLSELSVKRKVAMVAFIIMLLFLGVSMYKKIGIDSLPKFDVPYVQITTTYPGASPEEIEVDVAKRIEDAVASLDGLKHTTNLCMENVCATTLEFNLGIDADIMVHEVREKLNAIADEFPSGVETPTLTKINVNAIPVVTLFLTGNKSLDELYDYADDKLSDRFSSIQGVGEVRIHGGNELQLHIILDRKKLVESNLTANDIVTRIRDANIKIPAGRIRDRGNEINVTFDAEYRNMDALKNLEISSTQGKRIYLGDIAEIKLISKEIRQEGYYNGKHGVQIEIIKKSDANAVKVIDEVKKRFNEITSGNNLPGGMQLHWFKDSGEFIHASVDDAWSSIITGIILTAVILFLFLHDWRTTIIAAISMPVSVIIAFVAMKSLDYTFDMMTLVSLGCSAGVLVTNAVVVLENIAKKMANGADVKTAAIKGADEVITAVSASALTNVVVFVPVALMSSLIGLLISPFAGVMVVATIVSLFVSFTLTPILAAKLFANGQKKPNKLLAGFFAAWDFIYLPVERAYERSIEWTSRHYWKVIIGTTLLSVALVVFALPKLSMGFLPNNDKSELAIKLEFPTANALEKSRAHTLAIMKKLQGHPGIQTVTGTVGYSNASPGQVSEGVYIAEISLLLTPKESRKSIFVIADELRQMLAAEKNLLYSVNIPNPIGSSGAEVQAYISGPDPVVLHREGLKAVKKLEQSGLGKDIDSTARPLKQRINIRPDRAILRNLGIKEISLGTSVTAFFDGVEAGSYKVGDRTFDIRVKTNDVDGMTPNRNLVIGSLNGKPINIDTVANLESDPVQISIIRQDKNRSFWIYSNIAQGKTMGQVVEFLKKEVGTNLPPGYKLAFFGTAEMMQEGAADFANVFVIAIVMTYLLIAALMESWTHPFLIMFTVPLGFIGMFFTMAIAGEEMSMVALLGGVMMIGIVVNNAILIMDETRVLVNTGMANKAAMLTAVRSKFRPILMTSLASVIGMLPMAFGTGIGSELRSNCGLGVVGGLTYAAIMTVYLIPALYFAFVKDKKSKA